MLDPEGILRAVVKKWAIGQGLSVEDVEITATETKTEIHIVLVPDLRLTKNGRRRFRRSPRPITNDDWEKIMQLHWKKPYRDVLEEVRKSPDCSLPARLKGMAGRDMHDRINLMFLAHAWGYRFTTFDGSYWEGPFRLVAGEE
jgi:hypothetical protein